MSFFLSILPLPLLFLQFLPLMLLLLRIHKLSKKSQWKKWNKCKKSTREKMRIKKYNNRNVVGKEMKNYLTPFCGYIGILKAKSCTQREHPYPNHRTQRKDKQQRQYKRYKLTHTHTRLHTDRQGYLLLVPRHQRISKQVSKEKIPFKELVTM